MDTVVRRIITHLIDAMRSRGWIVEYVNDGEDLWRVVATTDDVIAHVLSVSESAVVFCNGRRRHGVVLIPSNGVDVISDYDFSESDDFEAVMSDLVDPFVESVSAEFAP